MYRIDIHRNRPYQQLMDAREYRAHFYAVRFKIQRLENVVARIKRRKWSSKWREFWPDTDFYRK